MLKEPQTHGDLATLDALRLPGNLEGLRILDYEGRDEQVCVEALERGADRVVALNPPWNANLGRRIERRSGSIEQFPERSFDLIHWQAADEDAEGLETVVDRLKTRLASGGLLILDCVYADSDEDKLVQRTDPGGGAAVPTRGRLFRRVLAGYAPRLQGHGVPAPHHPFVRNILHCTVRLPTVVLVRGPSRDGKTTAANELTRTAGQYIRVDSILYALAKGAHQPDEALEDLRRGLLANGLNIAKTVSRTKDMEAFSRAIAALILGEIDLANSLVVIDGYVLTDSVAALISERISDRAFVWEMRRSSKSF